MPAHEGRDEIYAYNCYVNDVFQGRAPGQVIEIRASGCADGDAFRIDQALEWFGPVEWAAPRGRLLLRETRAIHVRQVERAYVIDVESRIDAADFDIDLGPTRHAWFNFRVAPSLSVEAGGVLVDQRGTHGNAAQIDGRARWIAACGPVGGGQFAGVAMAPRQDGPAWWWFVTDWGVVTASPCRDAAIKLPRGTGTSLGARFVVHDGPCDPAAIDRMLENG